MIAAWARRTALRILSNVSCHGYHILKFGKEIHLERQNTWKLAETTSKKGNSPCVFFWKGKISWITSKLARPKVLFHCCIFQLVLTGPAQGLKTTIPMNSLMHVNMFKWQMILWQHVFLHFFLLAPSHVIFLQPRSYPQSPTFLSYNGPRLSRKFCQA